MKKTIVILAIITGLICSCSHGGDHVAIPLPTAYPRPNLPDTVLTDTGATPLRWAVNAQANVSTPKPGWLDIAYPTLGATVHTTFTSVSPGEIAEVKENRMQRLMLNAGERPVDFTEFVNPTGFNVLIASAEGSATPLQFIATDDSAWIVSGAVYFHSATAVTATDSIKPMLNAIRSDLTRALTLLNHR